MADAYNPREWGSEALRCLFCSTIWWDAQIPLRKEVFLKRNKVCFKGGQCPLPFAGLGEHDNRIRAGQGVEECSADWGLCHFTRKQVSSVFPFLFFFCSHDLHWLHDTTLTGSLFKTPCAEEHICQRFSSELSLSCAAGWQGGGPQRNPCSGGIAAWLDCSPSHQTLGCASLFSPNFPSQKA